MSDSTAGVAARWYERRDTVSPRSGLRRFAYAATLAVCLLAISQRGLARSPEEGARATSSTSETRRSFPPDLEGVWAQKLVQTAITDVPVFGESTTETITYLRVELDQSGRNFELQSRVCEMDIRSDVDVFETIVPRAFVDALPDTKRQGRLLRDGEDVQFRVERHVEVRGARLRSPEHEYLPDSPSDARVVDADDDGHPGLTLRIDGVVSGDIYIVQRGWDRYLGNVVSNRRMTGRVEWNSEQNVLDSTSIFLGDQPPTRPHPKAERNRVEFVRLDAGADCEDVVSKRGELF